MRVQEWCATVDTLLARAARGVGCVLLALAATACDVSVPIVSSVPTPALYFGLELGATDSVANDIHALVATASLPNDARYLALESVTAHRVSDGKPLAFEIVPRSGPIAVAEFGGTPTYSTSDGNLRLRAIGTGDQLGARDILPGDSIELRVVAEGTTLHGALRVPRRPELHVRVEGGERIVSWGADPGTAFFSVLVGGGLGGALLRDTVFNIDASLTPFALAGADSVRIFAHDANWEAYLVAPFRDVAGVRGGLGVFGAIVSGRTVALPPLP